MTLFILPGMYIIAERLKRPMRRHFGGKWISFLGIPPLTLLFIPLMFVTVFLHKRNVKRRVSNNNANGDETINNSWY